MSAKTELSKSIDRMKKFMDSPELIKALATQGYQVNLDEFVRMAASVRA